jgi:GT2 family glycosyltransferase
MTSSAKYQIIIPVFNRREITRKCLRQLARFIDRDDWRVCIVDDASTDGTAAAVAAEFPEVLVLEGTGNLYWTGAMELGMRHAVKTGAECCVWLNDDLVLHEDAVEQVVALACERQTLVCGQGVIHQETGSTWLFPGIYKGKVDLDLRDLDITSPTPIRVDACRGNLVAIHKNVIERIGYPDGKNIPHVRGDTDYGLRATAAGIECLALCSARFFEMETVRNDNRSWLLGKRAISKIWRASLSKRGNLYPRMLWIYYVRHWGFRGAIRFVNDYLRLLAASVLRLAIPRRFILRFYANHSHAYQFYKGLPDESEE